MQVGLDNVTSAICKSKLQFRLTNIYQNVGCNFAYQSSTLYSDMTDNNTDKKIAQLHSTAKQLVDQGKDDSTIISELCKIDNITENYATQILENIYNDKYNKKEFIKHVLYGSVIIIAGLLTNYLSYQFAIRSGAMSFLLIWGVVVFGITVLLRGVIIFKK